MSEILTNKRLITLALAFGLGAAACGGENNKRAEVTATSAEATQPANTNENPALESHTLIFDDLGARYSTVFVYPGVGNTDADRKPNGAFNDGEPVPAICKLEGREVNSVPPEPPRQSDDWIRIQGTPGETQYATAVYVENSQQLVSQLPEC